MMDFFGGVKQAVEKFRSISDIHKKVVRIYSNLDTDGISATSILVQAFARENIRFAVSIVKQIDDSVLNAIKLENYDIYFFLDLGSGCYKTLCSTLQQKKVFILDHHYPESTEHHEDFVHLNPHLYGLNGTKDISAAGVVYFFAKVLNSKNDDLSYLALLGAVGDVQEHNGFLSLNNLILQDALYAGKVIVKEGVRIYGISTKPLYKVLEYSTNPYIPGVCGSEEGSIKFLKDIGIQYRDGLTYRRYVDLSKEETEKLVTAIMMNKVNPEEAKAENVYGPLYTVQGEEEDFPTRDLHEFSTLLNCCGRLGKYSLGIGTCLGDPVLKEKAINLLREYQQEIILALQWFYANRNGDAVITRPGIVIINAGETINDAIIGTLTSLISKSLVYEAGTVIIGMARTVGHDTRISLRVSGFGEGKIDLRALVKNILEKTGGSGGGHSLAAGAMIPYEKEKDFIDGIKNYFSAISYN